MQAGMNGNRNDSAKSPSPMRLTRLNNTGTSNGARIKPVQLNRMSVAPRQVRADMIRSCAPTRIGPDEFFLSSKNSAQRLVTPICSRMPTITAELNEIVRGEFAENAIRKDFLPSLRRVTT
jgi:hypothetical protein